MLKRNMLALFAIAIALSASADGRKYYYLTTASNANLNEASKWSDPSTGNTLRTFDAGGDYWIVKNGKSRCKITLT